MFKFLEKKPVIPLIFLVIAAISIFYISSLQFPQSKPGFSIISILYHFLTFFWLSFFLLIFFVRGKNISLIIPSIILSLMYALSDEVHQLFVPTRACSFSDFIVDSFGILLAALIYTYSVREIRYFSEHPENHKKTQSFLDLKRKN
jgi:VanZ family protein